MPRKAVVFGNGLGMAGLSARADTVVVRMIAERTGARIDHVPNLALGLALITLGGGLLEEVTDIRGAVPHPIIARAASAAHKQHVHD